MGTPGVVIDVVVVARFTSGRLGMVGTVMRGLPTSPSQPIGTDASRAASLAAWADATLMNPTHSRLRDAITKSMSTGNTRANSTSSAPRWLRRGSGGSKRRSCSGLLIRSTSPGTGPAGRWRSGPGPCCTRGCSRGSWCPPSW